MELSADERRLRAQRAANARWRRESDRAGATLPARQAFLRSFERLVDPHRKLPEAERVALARDALIRHMRRLGDH